MMRREVRRFRDGPGVETLRGTPRRCICSRHSYYSPPAGGTNLNQKRENQRQGTWISLSFPDFRWLVPRWPPAYEHPPTTRPQHRREAIGRVNLSVAISSEARGQASTTLVFPAPGRRVTLQQRGVPCACLLSSPRPHPQPRLVLAGTRGPKGR